MRMARSKQNLLFLLPVLCAGCGIESLGNLGRSEYERPASAISGKLGWSDPDLVTKYSVSDGENEFGPDVAFLINGSADAYEIRLASSKYSMIEVVARVGNGLVRGLVPFVGEESKVTQDLDAMVCWFSERPMTPRNKYVVKHTTRSVRALVRDHRRDLRRAAPRLGRLPSTDGRVVRLGTSGC